MLEVLNYEIFGMDRAVKASGLPMAVDSSKITYSDKRANVLGAARAGSGHDCFLKGIIVEARVKYPLYWTKQFQRYHFADIVSSQSTMHRVTKFNLKNQCNEWVDPIIIQVIERKVYHYNIMEQEKVDYLYISDFEWMKECDTQTYPAAVEKVTKKDLFMQIISCLPSGFEMEMEIVTNYLQLKTILEQRKYHKLPDWRVFCDWIESLPNFKEFTTKEAK
ncbi:MAG: hypothetical protein ACRCX7_11200 [Cetobacterium sp.]|uniref:hypothetical protein n=1 Tax=Cetobacterium sp. TaxID=2071632 RepID=UPI003F40F67B